MYRYEKMKNQRYNEEYDEGSNLLWPSEEEDKITRKFYRDLSHLSKKIIHNKKKKTSIIKTIFRIITGKEGLQKNKSNNDSFNKKDF